MSVLPFDRVWHDDDRGTALVSAVLALSLHIGAVSLVRRLPMQAEPVEQVPLAIEMEDIPPTPASDVPPVERENEAATTVAPELTRTPPPRTPHQTAPRSEPAAAAAGSMLTASEDSDAPVRFASDPTGKTYASGVAIAGGEARPGRAGRGVGPAPRAGLSPPANVESFKRAGQELGSPPRLDEVDPCRSSFPTGATTDFGKARISLTVDARGVPVDVRITSAEPPDQGFGEAAAACLRAKKLVPARDREGLAVSAKVSILVRFSR